MVELRYPITEDAEDFFRILTEGKFENYYATIPESVELEREWIKKKEYKRANIYIFKFLRQVDLDLPYFHLLDFR